MRLEWLAGNDPRMTEVCDLRHRVLFVPFDIPRLDEWNDLDPASHHLVALENGRPIAYARLIELQDDTPQVRQVAVDDERQRSGVGTALMREVARRAQQMGFERIHLYARVSTEAFYHRLGWMTVSDGPFPYGRTGVPHVRMEFPLR